MSPNTGRILSRLWMLAGIFAAVTIGMLALRAYLILDKPAPEPIGPQAVGEADVPKLCGWAGHEAAKRDFAAIKDKIVPFLISTANGEPAAVEDKRAVLSEVAQRLLGHHIPTLRQEIGDCTSFGAANAIMYLTLTQMADGNHLQFREIFPPYIYGASRVLVGKKRIPCRSDGSTGAWTAAAMLDYGAVANDEAGVPGYSGRVASEWGCNGPPSSLVEIGKTHRIRSAAKVSTWQEARDAIVSGYPITVASDVGFRMSGSLRGKKLFLPPAGQWMHQMSAIGYDPAPEPCFLILNQWGEDAHKPINQDGPPGSFWITAKTMQRMLDADDSFAFSQFEGFPQTGWDLDLLKQREARHGEHLLPGHAGDRQPIRSPIALSF